MGQAERMKLCTGEAMNEELSGEELAAQFWASHKKQMDDLTMKYIGKGQMDHGLSMTEPWAKKHWYLHRIGELFYQAGRCNQRLRRCKPDSPTWKKYEDAENDMKLLAEHLMGVVMTMK